MHPLRVHRPEPDDSLAIARAQDGDAVAVSALVDAWAPRVYRFCRRMLGNDADAHDAAQDTLVKLIGALDRYDPQRPFAGWALGIARNTCIDEHRRRQRRAWDEPADTRDPGPSPLQVASRREQADLLHGALAELPPMYREVLVLYHFEHLKYAEIAECLELPIGTVMNRIFRARRKLRDLYDQLTEACDADA